MMSKKASVRIAFLKVLEHEGVIPNMEEICNCLMRDAAVYNFAVFTEIRPFEQYTPSDSEDIVHRLIVWRFHRDDKVSNEEILNLVGPEGYVLYVWICPRCKAFCRRNEHPAKPRDNGYFGCECQESIFLGACML